jgi:hypothetical protein
VSAIHPSRLGTKHTHNKHTHITTMAFWGLKLEPKKWTPFVPPPEEQLRLHISQVSSAAAAAPKALDLSLNRTDTLPSRRSPPRALPAKPLSPSHARITHIAYCFPPPHPLPSTNTHTSFPLSPTINNRKSEQN